MAIGSPSRRNKDDVVSAGAVFVYDLTLKDLKFESFKSMVESEEYSSRFGYSVDWLNHGDLVVGSLKYSGQSHFKSND